MPRLAGTPGDDATLRSSVPSHKRSFTQPARTSSLSVARVAFREGRCDLAPFYAHHRERLSEKHSVSPLGHWKFCESGVVAKAAPPDSRFLHTGSGFA